MGAHKMGPTRLNHGTLQCEYCHATDREIHFALGPNCPNTPAPAPTTAANPDPTGATGSGKGIEK